MNESELRAQMGRDGGLARAAKMSKRARRASAIKANKARWAKKKEPMTELNRKRALAGSVKGNSRQRRTAKRTAK